MPFAQNGLLVVQNYCDLSNRSISDTVPGGLAFVTETAQYFRLEQTSLAPVNDVDVLPVYGGPALTGCAHQISVGTAPGRWILTNLADVGAGGGGAGAVTEWFIDPVAGSDLNTGETALSPLKTFRALNARWASITTPPAATVSVYVINGSQLAAGDQATLSRPGNPAYMIRLFGHQTVFDTGSATAYQPPDPATNTSPQITGAPTGGWAASIGKLLLITAGPDIDCWCTIVEDLGAGVAKTSPLVKQNAADDPTLIAAPAGIAGPTAYQIIDPFKLTDTTRGSLYVDLPNTTLWIYDCNLRAGGTTSLTPFGVVSETPVYLYRGAFNGGEIYPIASPQFTLGACSVRSATGFLGIVSDIEFKACAVDLDATTTQGSISFVQDSILFPNTSINLNAARYNFSSFNIDKAASPAINLTATSDGIIPTATFSSSLYGATIPTSHISLHSLVRATYAAGMHWYAEVTALQHPLNFQNGIVKDYADLPFISSATFNDSQAALILAQ